MKHPSSEQTYNTIASHFSQTRSRPWKEFAEYTTYITPNDSILDIGCGNGRLYDSLPKPIHYTGIDISEQLLQEAHTHIPTGTFVHGSMTALPFPDQQFDVTIAIASFQHLTSHTQRKQALAEIYRVTKPNGIIILSNWDIQFSKHKKSFWKKVRDYVCSFGKISHHDFLIPWKSADGTLLANRFYHHVSEHEIKKLFAKQQITLIKIFHEFASKKNRNLCIIGRK